MGAVTVKQGGNKTVVVARDTVAKIQAMPRLVSAASPNAAQVIQRSNTVVPVLRPSNVEVGKMGLQGAPGKDGEGVDLHYRHVQSIPSADWTVRHNLGKYPSIAVIDSAGNNVIGHVDYDDANTCTLTFASAFSGEAHCN